ncbi:hypothetical protein JCM10450v2_000502 [Rhodotorula kratochvilovae]
MAPVAPAAGAAPLTSLSDQANWWTASVLVDHQPVEVCRVEHSERKTTCYIEAVEGKEFKVEMRKSWYTTDLATYLSLDGTEIQGFSSSRERLPTQPMTWVGSRISPIEIRPFAFAQIALTDDADEATNSEQVIKNLGTIQLEVYRTEILGTVSAPKQYKDPRQHVVDERSKKATMSHSTAFGAAKYSPDNSSTSSVRWIDPYRQPYYTLEFRYRSRALLELEGIVEAAPQPSPSPEPVASTSGAAAAARAGSGSSPAANRKKRKGSAISLSDDDDAGEDLRAKIARLETENAKLKGGVKREKEDVKPKVKGEPIGKVRTENGKTVIDLLDEDDD